MKISVAFGTRPEAIKLAPVIHQLKRDPAVELRILVSGQHRSLLDQVLRLFDIQPACDFKVMRPNQGLAGLMARILKAVECDLVSHRPDCMVVQGDTTTALGAAMAAYYQSVPIAHVEAGLRTGDRFNPFPEEINRKFIGSLAHLHFAPTERAAENLLREGIVPATIHVTGNTGIDALLEVAKRITDRCSSDHYGLCPRDAGHRLILVTSHRRETFGLELFNICTALRMLVERNEDVRIVYAVHPNPNVTAVVERELKGVPRVHLTAAPDYATFVSLMKLSFMILTDSGGVQEEAPSLGKPVLVLRSCTERTEAIEAGTAKLVGTDPNRIVVETERLLSDSVEYARMAQANNPYGDGHAAERVVEILLKSSRSQFAHRLRPMKTLREATMSLAIPA